VRSVRFHQSGELADVLHIEELLTPSPGPGEMLVRMRARPINPSDPLFIRGNYTTEPEIPAIPGFEGVGVVERVGPGQTGHGHYRRSGCASGY
jgi:NADPH:quinone reductase